jgi:hypothetical protein
MQAGGMVTACHDDPLHSVSAGSFEHLVGAPDVHPQKLRPGGISCIASEVDDRIGFGANLVEQVGVCDRALVDLDELRRPWRWWRDDVDETCPRGELS